MAGSTRCKVRTSAHNRKRRINQWTNELRHSVLKWKEGGSEGRHTHNPLPSSVTQDTDGFTRARSFVIPPAVVKRTWQLVKLANLEMHAISNGGLRSATFGEAPRLQQLKSILRHKSEFLPLVKEVEGALDGVMRGCLRDMGVNYKGDIVWKAGYLVTKEEDPQLVHTDFDPDAVDRRKGNWGGRARKHGSGKKFSDVVPYVMEFPLTAEGLRLEFWTDEAWDTINDCRDIENAVVHEGTIIRIPKFQAIMFRGDVLHSGGFKRRAKHYGNARFHIYVYLPGGMPLDTETKTHTWQANGKSGKTFFSDYCQSSCQWRKPARP